MQNFIKHMPHYISLIFIFIAGIIGFYVFSYDTNFQIGVAFALASAYVSWGIIHHTIHKDICLAIVIEYITVAILGMVITLSLVYRI
ncbi:MAG: hypothetical protein Q8Q30_01865 [Candidatus Woesebacteria bacterium]|nr:hypothetical protein [Candidatus Woesebacteria bacterium]